VVKNPTIFYFGFELSLFRDCSALLQNFIDSLSLKDIYLKLLWFHE